MQGVLKIFNFGNITKQHCALSIIVKPTIIFREEESDV
jgi:hypothetical protein